MYFLNSEMGSNKSPLDRLRDFDCVAANRTLLRCGQISHNYTVELVQPIPEF